jgi:hypothetical protein
MIEFSLRLKELLNEKNLTIYGAAQLIGAETDEPIKTVHQRLSRWVNATPQTWREIQIALAVLGYQIEINKVDKNWPSQEK